MLSTISLTKFLLRDAFSFELKPGLLFQLPYGFYFVLPPVIIIFMSQFPLIYLTVVLLLPLIVVLAIFKIIKYYCLLLYYNVYIRNKIFELNGFCNFYFDFEGMYIATGNYEGYNFKWNNFNCYFIKGKTLYLLEKKYHVILRFRQSKIGIENFNALFESAMEKLERLR